MAVNLRYRLLAYGDASFAVGETKQSITGLIIYLNGVPLLWGSLKQTVVVDSSSSAEFVAASVTCKQLLHAENMLSFLGFSSPKPYLLYTDSMACYHIASNPNRLGNVRHLQIRYHLVRCYVSLGDVQMCFCITEEMVADLLKKVVVGAQDHRLSFRFYSLIPESTCEVSACICIRVDWKFRRFDSFRISFLTIVDVFGLAFLEVLISGIRGECYNSSSYRISFVLLYDTLL